MKRRSGGSSALESIDPVFEPLDVGVGDRDFRDALGNFFGRIGEPRANGEQIFLQLFEQPGDVAGELTLRADASKAGVQLVDVAVRGDAQIRLRDARSTEQRRAAGVAGARVDLHGRQYT